LPNEWVAWLGACTGVASLGWNIYTKITSGPKVVVEAWAGLVTMPTTPGDPRYLKVVIKNNGTARTTITNLCLLSYEPTWKFWKSRRKRELSFSAVLNDYEGPRAPFELDIGREATILMPQDEEFVMRLDTGKLLFGVFYSYSRFPILVKILVPRLSGS
jgi:hypothetical protein